MLLARFCIFVSRWIAFSLTHKHSLARTTLLLLFSLNDTQVMASGKVANLFASSAVTRTALHIFDAGRRSYDESCRMRLVYVHESSSCTNCSHCHVYSSSTTPWRSFTRSFLLSIFCYHELYGILLTQRAQHGT